MAKDSDQIRQHARLAMGKNIGHPAGGGRGFKHGGVIAQQTGKDAVDKTVFQKYGSGYRKIQGK